MNKKNCTITVSLGSRSYPIHIGRGHDEALHSYLEALATEGRTCAIVTDSTVELAQSHFIDNTFHEITRIAIPAGEASKSLSQLENVLEVFSELRLDRRSVIFAIGGGVVGDLAGFAAACFMRGVDFVQIPTTLLAMVDSSVGGKTGVNLRTGKNLVGAFLQPQAVFIDTARLDTLDAREFAAGMAEIIKAGLLADLSLFESLEANPITDNRHPRLMETIKRACEIKASVVEGDETEIAESGGRALLNLGHTFGHAIEKLSGYASILHGEAVAIGLQMATVLSCRMGLIEDSAISRVKSVLERHKLPTRLPKPMGMDALLDAMSRDKKNRAGHLRLVLLSSLGRAITHSEVPRELVVDALKSGGAQ